MKKKIIVFCIILIFLATGCTPDKNQYISDNAFLLDTVINIRIYDQKDKKILKDAFDKISDLEDLLSVHRIGSDPFKINEGAGKEWVDISEETLEILAVCQEISSLSNGYFDVTVGPLVKLWGIKPPNGYVPTKDELINALLLVDYRKLKIDSVNSKAFLEAENMEINLGAIAKGYIAEKIKEQLIEKGVKSGVINLGGNIVIIGNRVDGKGFMVGVQEPNSGRNEYLGLVEVSDKAVVSSGTYERFFEQDGKRYHHILNPYTGVPEENSLDGVTVIAEDSTYADALSTTFFLLGLEDGLSLAEGMKEVQAVFITKDKKIYTTSGLRNNFKLEKDTEYVMVK